MSMASGAPPSRGGEGACSQAYVCCRDPDHGREMTVRRHPAALCNAAVTNLRSAWFTVHMVVTTPRSATHTDTANAALEFAQDDRPAYRPFTVTVAAVHQLSPHFLRITLTGADLKYFSTAGDDQRVKVFFPAADGTLSSLGMQDGRLPGDGSWYEQWRHEPEGCRSPMRTYTVRAVRPEQHQIDIDMVVHADAGPASRWAQQARAGDMLRVVGADARSRQWDTGRDWSPRRAREVLLAGDETAAPAICAILENLRPGIRARAFLEVPSRDDFLRIDLPERAEITWLARAEHCHGEELVPTVRQWARQNVSVIAPVRAVVPQELDEVDVDSQLLWDSPVLHQQSIDSCGRGQQCGGEFYAWFAGEAGVIKTLRRFLVSELGVCRRRVAFMGYWRRGRAEAQ